MADLVGQQFGDYRLIRFLGKGTYTDTYLGEHIHLNNKVAIKIVKFFHDIKEAFEEVRLITHLKHPHIVQVLDFGGEDQIPFLVVDYAPNGTLLQRHPKGIPVPLAAIVEYIKQIAPALQYAHDQKRVYGSQYRTISPDDILVGLNNNILLSDLTTGIEWYQDDHSMTREEEHSFEVNIFYMAPEQIKAHPRPASDQYSLAIVVYEWLCGDCPFKETSLVDIALHHIRTTPPSLRKKNPEILPTIEEVVMKALAKDPKDRFESVQAFADALEKAYLSSIRPKTPDRVGQQFGSYRLLRLLGHGGFADVYLGQHRRLNTYAAIKVLHTRLSNEDLEGFQKEAQTIANLRHPSIVRVLDFDVEGDTPFLVMDHAPNGTLRDCHPKGSRVPLTTIVSYVKQIAAALQYAHDQKLIHRDVKPENMLLGPNNEVLLSDFGIAAVAHSTASLKTQAYSGTVHYSAPEQISGKPRPASDQYALGIVVYEWLTGTRPFSGDLTQLLYQHISVPPPPLRGKDPTIPRAVEQVIMITLAKDPQRRFASVQAFATALEQACRQGS